MKTDELIIICVTFTLYFLREWYSMKKEHLLNFVPHWIDYTGRKNLKVVEGFPLRTLEDVSIGVEALKAVT